MLWAFVVVLLVLFSLSSTIFGPSFHRFVRELGDFTPPEEDIVFAGTRRSPLAIDADDGICPVCGDRLGNDSVLCRECLTPHHRHCFRWNGSCGTFACGCAATYAVTPVVRRHFSRRPTVAG